MRGPGTILQLHEYCNKCKGTTAWVLNAEGTHYKCQGDPRHPERRLYGCDSVREKKDATITLVRTDDGLA